MADVNPNPNPLTAGGPPSQDTTLPLLRAHPLLGREENMKLLFDKMMSETMGDADLRDVARSRARLDVRRESNGVAFDKAMDTILTLGFQNVIISAQTGDTTDQTASGPEHTAEGAEDTGNAAVGTANAQVAANIANLASALVPIITGTSAVALSVTQLATAVLAAVTAASGAAANNAATPTTPAK